VTGRFAEQRNRLKSCNVKVIFILENFVDQLQSPFGKRRFSEKVKSVSGALENLVLFHDMFVLPTHSVKHTAQVLKSIRTKLEKRGNESSLPNMVTTQKKDKMMENMFHHQLLLVPGVSPEIANKITRLYPKTRNLCDAYAMMDSTEGREKMLENIPLERRRLGKILSKRIHDVYN
jgi:ERCC4-type nuclease